MNDIADVRLLTEYDGSFNQCVTNQPTMANSTPIHLGSVNEYQLQPGRQRQVWFIPSVDECRVCIVPLRTRAIPERLTDVFMTRRYTNPRLPYL